MLVQRRVARATGLVAKRDLVQRPRIAHGQRTQHVRIEDGERRRHQTEAKTDRQHDGEREPRRSAEDTQRITHILRSLLQRLYTRRAARLLGERGDIPERAARCQPRVRGALTTRDASLDIALEVIAHLLVQLVVGRATPDECADTHRGRTEHPHATRRRE